MDELFPTRSRKRKVDTEALQSPLSRIPGMHLSAARDLIDLGIVHIGDLHGRDPRVLLEETRRLRPDTPNDRLGYFRLAVYYSETSDPDPAKLQPHIWMQD